MRLGAPALVVVGHHSALRERVASSREGRMQTPRLSAAALKLKSLIGTSEAAGPTVRCSLSAASTPIPTTACAPADNER
jgi:hypothetical protein